MDQKREARKLIPTGLPGFDTFWEHYPKRSGKKDAQRLWAKIDPSPELLQTMLQALAWQRHQPQWIKDGGQYVPMAETWLRGERWTDEPFDAPQLSEKTTRTLGAIYGTEHREGHS